MDASPAYTNFNTSDFDPDQPVDNYRMYGLAHNPIAIANGAAGAPSVAMAALASHPFVAADYGAGSVNQTAIGSGAVGQSELKSATASQSVVVNGNGFINPTGGIYTMGWFASSDNPSYARVGAYSGTYQAKVGFTETWTSGSVTFYLYSRYIQASPPYNLGNGDIPVFIYALIAKAGNTAGILAGTILATSVAVDPAWAYNGPDHINPNNLISMMDGSVIEMVKDLPWSKAEAMIDPVKMQENIAAILSPTYIPEVVDMARKLRNMPNMPHPFDGDPNLPHGEVVLLDPLSPLAMAAFELVGEEDHGTIKEMLEHPSLVIDSAPISGLITPPGVMGVKVTL